MRYLLIGLLALAGMAQAETLEELKARLDAAPNVIAVGEEGRGTFMPGVFSEIYFAKVIWLMDEGETVKKDSKDVLILNMGVQGQELVLGWLGEIPAPIKPAAADAYITGRTVPFTKAQVESFCNTQWKATSGNAAARDVIEFTVENVTPNSVKVRGLFHDVATNNRVRLTYLISLVDANGATSGANVKFEKVVE